MCLRTFSRWVGWVTVSKLMLCGLAMRVVLILWGEFQDRTMRVKYTDVDYFVYSDAGRCLVEGKSPYDRKTFRYSPLLAALLSSNILVHPYCGKILFSVLDIVAARYVFTSDLCKRWRF
jgi:GPI mannosyltransferase 1 subunit M